MTVSDELLTSGEVETRPRVGAVGSLDAMVEVLEYHSEDDTVTVVDSPTGEHRPESQTFRIPAEWLHFLRKSRAECGLSTSTQTVTTPGAAGGVG